MIASIDSAIALDQKVHLGLLAVTATLIIWALGSARQLGGDIRILRARLHRGFGSRQVFAGLLLKYSELGLKALGSCLAVAVIYYAFRYFETAEKLVGPGAAALDGGLFHLLWENSEALTHSMLAVASLAIAAFLSAFVIGSIPPWIGGDVGKGDLPNFSHSFCIPRSWREFPEAMWEERLQRVQARLANEAADERIAAGRRLTAYLDSGVWRHDWQAWAECVHAHQVFVDSQREEQESTGL